MNQSELQMVPLPNHPSAFYWTGYDRFGRYWIQLHCAACGDRSQKQCSNPARTNHWLMWYGGLHLHRG